MKREKKLRPRKTQWASLAAMAASLLMAGSYFISGRVWMGILWLAAAALFFGGFARRPL
ncbi:MAG: hypothetical protein Q4G07_03035 [Oscillospiraceae bacterium]|nr:hypothetical protein [Oscillospiraceae bacterium]